MLLAAPRPGAADEPPAPAAPTTPAAAEKLAVPAPVGPPARRGFLARVLAAARLPALVARRDAAAAALQRAEAVTGRPDPAPFAAALAQAQACEAAAADALAVADASFVGARAGVSIDEVRHACEVLRASAESGVARAQALREQRATALRPLLKGDRAKLFAERGEPLCACADGDWPAVARAKEWRYVRGPDGPLGTYETLIFVFRGDTLVERRQRVSHERP